LSTYSTPHDPSGWAAAPVTVIVLYVLMSEPDVGV
jgi:hypothetical protein